MKWIFRNLFFPKQKCSSIYQYGESKLWSKEYKNFKVSDLPPLKMEKMFYVFIIRAFWVFLRNLLRSWNWGRPRPPCSDKFPTVTIFFILMAPLTFLYLFVFIISNNYYWLDLGSGVKGLMRKDTVVGVLQEASLKPAYHIFYDY